MFPELQAPPSMPWCCDNWWWNVIGKRRELAKIGVLFYDRLAGLNGNTAPVVPDSSPEKTVFQAIIEDMPDNVERHSNEPNETEKYTGANLTDVAVFLVVRGVLDHDYINGDNSSSPFIEYAISEVENEALTPASGVPCNEWDDGIQLDNSFFQHDKILYSSGYGYSFIRSLSYIGTFLKGTTFDFAASNRDFLLNAILDGWRWMIRGDRADYSVSGRNITRDGGDNHTGIPVQEMVWLIEMAEGNDYDCLPIGHSNYIPPQTLTGIALEDMKNRILTGQRQDVLGAKHFWMADYVAYHENDFFTSVKMCATQIADVADPACVATPLHEDINLRTTGTESRNDDNRRGYWLPYGCTFIYQTGEEENGVLEVYNSNHSNFVGSTSNETFAVTTMELDKNHPDGHLQARKAWFHFGGEIIALGAGITDDSDEDVFTTLNQCWENGTVTESTSTHEDYDWVHHDDIAYLYLDPSDTNLDYTDDMDGLLDGNGAGIENVEIYDDNPSTNNPSILLTTTSSTGSYAIQNLLLGLDHELNPKKDDDYYNGISSFDLVLMTKHILELELLDSPYKIIAGDVNKSGSVSTNDIIDLRKLILHIDEELENVDSWEFVRSTHLFPNPLNPFQVNPDFPDDIHWPFPQTAEINGLQLISSSRDFVGIKMGDVGCSAQANSLQPPCPESSLQLLAEDRGIRAGNTFTVPIYAETFKNIAAYQMGLLFAADKLQFNGLQQGDLNKGAKADNFNLNKTAQGKIKTLWLYNEATDLAFTVLDITLADTSALFVLEFEALQDVPSISSVISIDQSYEAEALPGNGDCYKTIDLQFVQEGSIGERSAKQYSQSQIMSLYIQPNPGKEEVNISCQLNQPSQSSLRFFSTTGKLIYYEDFSLQKGFNALPTINTSSWSKGMYYYQLQTGETMQTGKWVKE